MLTRPGAVKVMDFGIARAIADAGMTMTQTAAVIGTAQYLSPEQAQGETVDARSRPLLHRLPAVRAAHRPAAVRRRLPGRGGLPARARGAAAAVAPTTPRSAAAIDAIVLKSLAKNPDDRYQSAAEMRADIERALDGRPTEAQTAVLGAANMPTQRLDPRQVGAAAAVGQTRAMPAVESPTGYQSPVSRYDDEYGDSGRPPVPPRRAEPRRPPEPEKSGRTGYIILAVAGIAAIIAAVLLAKSLLKSGGNSSTKAVPDFGIGTTNVTQAQAMLAKPEYAGFSLSGSGKDCPAGTDVHSGTAGTIIAQTPAANGTYQKPGPITYCLSLGPQNGKVPAKATLNTWTQDTLKAYLTGAHFDVSNPVISQAASDTVPPNNIIDVIDANNNNQVLDGQQVPDVSKVQIGWVVSTGKNKIPLNNTGGYKGQPYGGVVSQIKGLGFSNVTSQADNTDNGQTAGNVTRISVGDGQYTADTPIVVYYAPQPPPSTPSSSQSQCDPGQDPNCQQNPTSTNSGPGNGQTSNPMICVVDPQAPGCPGNPTTSKKGGGGN